MESWSEWLESPAPVKRSRVLRAETDARLRATMADPDLRDEELGFGAMFMGGGAAFPLEKDNPEQGYEPDVPVGKLWIRVADPKGGPERTFLIEQVEYPSIRGRLQVLPHAAALKPDAKNAQMAALPRPSDGRGIKGEGSSGKGGRQSVARHFPPGPAGSTNAAHALLARSLSHLPMSSIFTM